LTTATTLRPLRPNFSFGYARLLTEVVRSTVPVPLSADCCGLVPALSVRVRVALCAPSVAGAKVTPSLQFPLAATVIGIGPQEPAPVTMNSDGSDDIALEMISGLVRPVLVTVTVFATD
jgi:hypothetical protein